jgi:hypothetical protein
MTDAEASERGGWWSRWSSKIADGLRTVKIEGHTTEVKATRGPTIYVTIKGAADDATLARITKARSRTILDKAIEEEVPVQGFSSIVRSFNKDGIWCWSARFSFRETTPSEFHFLIALCSLSAEQFHRSPSRCTIESQAP